MAAQLTRGNAHLVNRIPLISPHLRVILNKLVAIGGQGLHHGGGRGLLIHIGSNHRWWERCVINGVAQSGCQLGRGGGHPCTGGDELTGCGADKSSALIGTWQLTAEFNFPLTPGGLLTTGKK